MSKGEILEVLSDILREYEKTYINLEEGQTHSNAYSEGCIDAVREAIKRVNEEWTG